MYILDEANVQGYQVSEFSVQGSTANLIKNFLEPSLNLKLSPSRKYWGGPENTDVQMHGYASKFDCNDCQE